MRRLVHDTAVQMGVDPALALAHAHQESGFDHRAVSPADAVGAMQVIPDAGDWASGLVGRELDLLDPQDNVTAGVAIMTWAIWSSRFFGKRSAMAPAYGDSSRIGRNWSPVVMPRAAPLLLLSSSTSQSWAMRCIQVPMLETKPPV